MTTDTTPTTAADRLADTDAAQRHRELRRQYVEQQRVAGDGHNRRPAKSTSKAELRRRSGLVV